MGISGTVCMEEKKASTSRAAAHGNLPDPTWEKESEVSPFVSDSEFGLSKSVHF